MNVRRQLLLDLLFDPRATACPHSQSYPPVVLPCMLPLQLVSVQPFLFSRNSRFARHTCQKHVEQPLNPDFARSLSSFPPCEHRVENLTSLATMNKSGG